MSEDLGLWTGTGRHGTDRPAASGNLRGGGTAAAALLLAALTVGLLDQGAFVGQSQWFVGVLVVGAAIVSLATRPAAGNRDRWWPVAAAGLLAGWSILVAVLNGAADAALGQVLLLGGVVLVLDTCRRLDRASRDLLLNGLIVLGVLVAVTGWLGVVLHREPWGMVAQGLWRASSAITYPNATAAVLVPLALVAVAGLAAHPRSISLSLAATGLLTGTAVTGSRAGLLALAAGLLVLAGLLGVRAMARIIAGPAAGAVFAVMGTLPAVPDKAPTKPMLAAGAVLLGLGFSALLARITRRAAALAVSAVAVAGLVLVAVEPVLVGMAVRQLSEARLTLSSPDRIAALRAAALLIRESPLLGAGPGQARLLWADEDGQLLTVRYVHNEYVQTTTELGVIGLALLAVLLAVVTQLLWRSKAGTLSPALWAGVTAGMAALMLHSGFDFVWHLPAIPLTAAALIGIAAPVRLLAAPPRQPIDRQESAS